MERRSKHTYLPREKPAEAPSPMARVIGYAILALAILLIVIGTATATGWRFS
jgi:hypothetical protein